MCLAVYLASSKEIPGNLRGNPDAPGVHLKAVPEGAAVHRHFSVPHVYYVGSHEGCGCGFFKEGRIDEDLVRAQADYVALARCIRSAHAAGATVELFSCWEGEQAENPACSETRAVEEIEDPTFEFRESHFLSVCP